MPLAVIAQEKGPAVERLHRWLEQLMTLKSQKVLSDIGTDFEQVWRLVLALVVGKQII